MYFKNFPLLVYVDADNQNNRNIATNILTRSAFLREITENSAIFYSYQIKNGETPEIIADKLYGDPNRHWIVLLFNKIMNPMYEFPLDDKQLIELVTKKYDQTYENSLTTIHHHEQRVTSTVLFNGIPQSSSEEIHTISAQQLNQTTGILETTPYLPGTADTYLDAGSNTEVFDGGITVQTTYRNYAISNYTYELTENEKRRTIKLLDKNYVVSVESEFKSLMQNGN
jgi:hypothetical protein